MSKKPKKFHEEKIAENFFPMDETNLKNTTEKQVKEYAPEKPTTSVEKTYNRASFESIQTVEKSSDIRIPQRKKSSRKKFTAKKKTSRVKSMPVEKKYSPQKISLKKDGYELVITEKPQAALKIANALGKAVQKNFNKIPYYEVSRKGKKIIVACAVGHLFTLKQNVSGSDAPVFDISWIPNYLAKKNDFTKKYYDVLLKMAKDAGSITVATDYDIEGETIGLNVVRFICGQEDASRMKFSTLTPKELDSAYENKSSTLSWGQAIAGETRHYLDWFYGINLSRALMNAIKTTGKFRIMSIGRVQGPALNLIVRKEKEIQKFKPETYWQVFITIDEPEIKLKYIKDIFDRKELDKFENLVGRKAFAETKKTKQILPPNTPFDLTTLQTEAYKFYGLAPSKTLQIAQSLYLAGLISYPRTSSQKLPDSIGYEDILKKLAKEYNVERFITKRKPIEGKKSDPAHPSIYPTGNTQILSGDEEKIYDLIVRRFLALFCDDAIIDKKRITAKIDDLTFSANGSQISKKAWMEIYPSKLKEAEIPDAEGEVSIINKETEEKETQPERRYSQASIISELEKKNLGTKATRSSILETLYDRGYVSGKSIEATPLGISLIDTLEKYSPIIIDEKLTRNFEKEMESIQDSFKGDKTILIKKEEKIIEAAKKTIIKIFQQFGINQNKIGEELLDANVKLREQQKKENTLVQCPECKTGNLVVMYSKKTRRNFVACDAYPNCKTTYSLPPNSIIKKTDKICPECNFPMLMSLRKGKKPWIFCFNVKCPTNQKALEEYRKRKEAENSN
jgi:DNA topoisomerase-1